VKYVYLFFFGVILIGLQTMIANLFFSGKLVVEISLLMVLYAGFNMAWIRGGIFCFVIGFWLDCFMGSVSGLFALIYLAFFLLAKFVSPRVYAEKILFIMIFVGLCSLVEGMLVILFYRLAFDLDKVQHIGDVFLPQAIIVGLLAPSVFSLFRRLKVFSDAGNTRSAERSAIG
jgi:cell shape-determining protein MreD